MQDFLDNPTVDSFDKLRKVDLVALAGHYKVAAVKSSMKKQEVRNMLIDYLVMVGVLGSEAIELKWVPPGPSLTFEEQLKLKELTEKLQMEKELALENVQLEKERLALEKEERLALEKERLALEERKMEQEFALKKLELGVRGSDTSEINKGDTINKGFSASHASKLLPKFLETEVDDYFNHFEKVAHNLKWPEDQWISLLQTVLIGKARETFIALSVEDCQSYVIVKKAILKAYELVPEAYRIKFRSHNKADGQNHVDFAKDKVKFFQKWINSKHVDNDFDKLKQLILLEEFKKCIHPDIKTYLDEHDIDKLQKAASMADDYFLTHKLSSPFHKHSFFKSGVKGPHGTNHSSNAQVSTTKSSSVRSHSPSAKVKVQCGACNRIGHVEADCWVKYPERKPKCMVCKTNEHTTRECTSPRKKFGYRGGRPKPVTLCSILNEKHVVSNHVGSKVPNIENVDPGLRPFVVSGTVSIDENDNGSHVNILRDSGAVQSLIAEGVLPLSDETYTGRDVVCTGMELGIERVPLHRIYVKSSLVTGYIVVGLRPRLPADGVSLALANDVCGKNMLPNPIVCSTPLACEDTTEESQYFPVCAVQTRSMRRKEVINSQDQDQECQVNKAECFDNLNDTFMSDTNKLDGNTQMNKQLLLPVIKEHINKKTDDMPVYPCTRENLIKAQHEDNSLLHLNKMVLTDKEIANESTGYYMSNGVLMRKWRPKEVAANEDWMVYHQVVVPQQYRRDVFEIAHSNPMSGHLGINKSYNRLLKHFYWPGMHQYVANMCRSCHTCQIVGKPNQTIPPAPLHPIPAFGEPFSRVIIDCVGPLPKTSNGHEYLLTIMCASTRFPEAIPLRSINSRKVVEALVQFFTRFGLPLICQSDQGSNFTAKVFKQIVDTLGIKHSFSTAYHPESQGALERYHQTLKTMLKCYCEENPKDWDVGVPLVLFASRDAIQESLGFSPFELVFGHTVRGPLQLLKEQWLEKSVSKSDLLTYVASFKDRLFRVGEFAKKNLKSSQARMKARYDSNTVHREFHPGDKVLAFLPVDGGSLCVKYHGPYVVLERKDDLNYVISTPDRRKNKQICHINMLKLYIDQSDVNVGVQSDSKDVRTVGSTVKVSDGSEKLDEIDIKIRLKNSEVLNNLDVKLGHLPPDQKAMLSAVIYKRRSIFPDVPSRTNVIEHDVDVGDAKPIKQHPYRLNPLKAEIMDKEIQYMLENDLIEESVSDWSSPCILIPKPDGSSRFCTDYRKVNDITKSDTFPIPRVDDCIDKIGSATYISTFDLLKGYWQVPLTERAKDISAFVTPSGLYRYKVMPFGMKNSGATFQRMMNKVLAGVKGAGVYIDDIITYNSGSFVAHVNLIDEVFARLERAKLAVNLAKSVFCRDQVDFLGHGVGHGQVRPLQAKVEAISQMPIPDTRKKLLRFLGMAGFYRRFCPNFSVIAVPLTNLLRKVKFVWTEDCTVAFERVKSLLLSSPVLVAADYSKQFILAVDASDLGLGSVLLQEHDGIDHPVAYFSKKFTSCQKNYSTIEKECLALILSLQHFDVYLSVTLHPVLVLTDHNPLVFISKMKAKNQRILRWSLLLQTYNLIIRHVRGRDNIIPDTLSRL